MTNLNLYSDCGMDIGVEPNTSKNPNTYYRVVVNCA